MLTQEQLETLKESERVEYLGLDEEGQASFEYFWGFAYGKPEVVEITNKEVELYQQMTDKISLKATCELLDFVPHKGQQPIVYTMDNKHEVKNSFVIAAGRRFGKSRVLGIVAIRELLIPFSSTILVAPTFNNARIIFTAVLDYVKQLNLPVKSMNKGNFRFELQNGAKFSSNSAANIEAALGSSNSLLLVEEAQSVQDLDTIHKQMLAPTMLDYGVRPGGVLYARQFFIGTSRGVDNQLYDYFCKEEQFDTWQSFTSPSTSNPTLPASYFEQMRLELGQMLYDQEILAKFVGSGDNVFYAFSEANIYEEGSRTFKGMEVIAGLDVGFRDSTAGVWLYRDARGFYYLDKAYSKAMLSTSKHMEGFATIEKGLTQEPDMRYLDPSAAQTRVDWINDYNYICHPAKNAIKESIAYINQLLTPTGANEVPRLYINSELKEMHRQLKRVRWKDGVKGSTKGDPFTKDSEGTHWDLIASLRYALYSDMYSTGASFVFSSEVQNAG